LLLLIQEREQFLVDQCLSSIFKQEVELLQNISKEDLSGVILACEKDVLVLLVKLSDDLWVNFLFS
jgi:hypothetical protein